MDEPQEQPKQEEQPVEQAQPAQPEPSAPVTQEQVKKHASKKFLKVLLALAIIMIVAFAILTHIEKKGGFEQIKTTGETEKIVEETTAQEALSDIEQIKMDIVTGKREDVPPELNLTKRTIIKQYLYDCYMIQNLNQKLTCYELYFLNVDETLKQQKEGCEALSGDEKTKCLDNYYFKMATQSDSFCEAIMDEQLRNQCKSTAI